MLKLCRATKVKVFFLVLVYVFNFDLFEFSAAVLKKGLLSAINFFANSSFIPAIKNGHFLAPSKFCRS